MRNPTLWFGGGIAGVISICCYVLAVALPWPENQFGTSASLIVVSGFPIFGVMYSYALYSYVAAEREGAVNTLGLIFASVAFTILLAMLFVQLAVKSGVPVVARDLDGHTAEVLRRSLRMVDLGLDVAWDFLIGTALILWGLAMRKRSGLGPWWGMPSLVFGIALIGLNASTFPIPPANSGLFDIGPAIALFMLALNVRLAVLGKRELAGAVTVPA